MIRKITSRLSYTQLILLSFMVVILSGSALLMLPIATKAGLATDLLDALFTATSATCVTGLVVYDTFAHWSLFGQLVILVMIQIGGLGFMTVISVFALMLKRKLGVYERKLLMESAGSLSMSGIVKLLRRIVAITGSIEGIGAVVLSFRFCKLFGFWQGVYFALFHSISAFCNAGFDLLGCMGEYVSLTVFQTDPLVILTIGSLIIIGGLGFLVWNDIIVWKMKFSKLSLHSKTVIAVTASLLVISALLFYIFESDNTFASMSFGQKVLNALFASITPRTAGFNAIDLSAMSDSSCILTTVLMLIGGSPGSTAGGIKTTTFAILIMSIIRIKGDGGIVLFKRNVSSGTAKQASAILTLYLIGVLCASMAICALDGLSMRPVIFEVASAIGTVGLSMDLTRSLGVASKLIIIFLMYFGRTGALSVALSFASRRPIAPIERPEGKILIG